VVISLHLQAKLYVHNCSGAPADPLVVNCIVALWVAISYEKLEIRPAILHGDTLPLVRL